MGRQTARTFARAGANVALNFGTYRTDEQRAGQAVEEIKAYGVRCVAVQADTRRQEANERLIETAERELGPIDFAVGNAGGDLVEQDVAEIGADQWRSVLQAELDGAFLLARSVLPGMRERGAGRVIFIGWEAADRAYRPPVDYSVGKSARHDLAWKLARSEEARGITVNTVAPGYIPYPDDEEARQLAEQAQAWTRRSRSTTQDVAEAVLWLCGEPARFVTGSLIRVYGPY